MSVENLEPRPAAEPGGADPHRERRWWILVILGIAQLMVILDTTVVNIALPTAQRDLAFSNDQRQWIVTAYALAFGSLMLLGGRLADLMGRKRLFLLGLAGFALASAVGGAANSFAMLVTARAVQGAFGAMLAPAALALLTTTFTDPKERGKAFGVYGAIAGAGGTIGLVLGGVLTEYLSWRWCMYVNLFFAAFAFAGGLAWLHHRVEENRPRLDIPGILLVSSGLFCLVYGVSHAQTAGWSNGETISFLVAAGVLLCAFVVLQSRVSAPALPLRILLDRYRGGALLALFFASASMFGMFLFLTYYLQQTLGFSAVKAGLAFLPMSAALVVAAQLGTNALAPRVGPRFIIAPGLAIGAVGMFLLTRIDSGSTYASTVLAPLIIFGVGFGLTISAAMSLSTAGVLPDDAGAASAMVNTTQQVGGSIGTAVLSTIAATAVSDYMSSQAPSRLAAAHALLNSYPTVFGWSAAILAVGAVVAGVVLPGRVRVPAEGEIEVMVAGG